MSSSNTWEISSEKRSDPHTGILLEPGNGVPHLDGHLTPYPNALAKFRAKVREPAAEFFGTMMLVLFGTAANCQVTLSSSPAVASSPKGDYLSICFGWACGIALAVWVSGGISGGHVNPAVTIALATFRDFPWRKVPAYIAAQVLGAFCAAGIVYGNYMYAIDQYEGGKGVRTLATASLFGTYALDYVPNASAWFDEFLGTALLIIAVLALSDKKNAAPPPGLASLVLFVFFLAVSACLGMQTGFAINPARDFGPRLLTSMVGYGKQVYTFRNEYWIWCPILAPICGGLAGAFTYDLLVYTGPESLLNRPRRVRNQPEQHATDAEGADNKV